jgi:hypothetical protein
VNPFTVAEELEPVPLFGRCVKESREPDQRYGDAPAISEIDGELVV